MSRSRIIIGVLLLIVGAIVFFVKAGSDSKPVRPASSGGMQIRVP